MIHLFTIHLYLAGKVPVLVHEGRVIYESVVTCDYIDDVFPGVKLNPDNPGTVEIDKRKIVKL